MKKLLIALVAMAMVFGISSAVTATEQITEIVTATVNQVPGIQFDVVEDQVSWTVIPGQTGKDTSQTLSWTMAANDENGTTILEIAANNGDSEWCDLLGSALLDMTIEDPGTLTDPADWLTGILSGYVNIPKLWSGTQWGQLGQFSGAYDTTVAARLSFDKDVWFTPPGYANGVYNGEIHLRLTY